MQHFWFLASQVRLGNPVTDVHVTSICYSKYLYSSHRYVCLITIKQKDSTEFNRPHRCNINCLIFSNRETGTDYLGNNGQPLYIPTLVTKVETLDYITSTDDCGIQLGRNTIEWGNAKCRTGYLLMIYSLICYPFRIFVQ